jgi:hypothetical protein
MDVDGHYLVRCHERGLRVLVGPLPPGTTAGVELVVVPHGSEELTCTSEVAWGYQNVDVAHRPQTDVLVDGGYQRRALEQDDRHMTGPQTLHELGESGLEIEIPRYLAQVGVLEPAHHLRRNQWSELSNPQVPVEGSEHPVVGRDSEQLVPTQAPFDEGVEARPEMLVAAEADASKKDRHLG